MLRARIAGELTSLHPFARKSEELIHLHGFYFLTVMPCNNAKMGITCIMSRYKRVLCVGAVIDLKIIDIF